MLIITRSNIFTFCLNVFVTFHICQGLLSSNHIYQVTGRSSNFYRCDLISSRTVEPSNLQNKILKISFVGITTGKCLVADNTSSRCEDNENDEYKGENSYVSPTYSQSFLKHLSSVQNSYDMSSQGEGIDCTGEPSIDPSRTIQDNGLDSEWLEDF